MNNSTKNIIKVVVTAFLILIGISFIPLDKLTNNYFKSYNLFSDIFPKDEQVYVTNDILDPELAKLEEFVDTIVVSEADNKYIGNADSTIDVAVVPSFTDTIEAPKKDGIVLIEDYSEDQSGIPTLRSSLLSSENSLVRIAILGDSYIEGDIFSQDLRIALQDKYGGSGVGYVPAFTDIPGFRNSVRQSGSGWETVEIRNMKRGDARVLQGVYHIGSTDAKALYKGTSKLAHCNSWDSSTLMFIAPNSGSITLNGPEGCSASYPIEPSNQVQALQLKHTTSKFGFTINVDSIKVLGAWLDANSGIALDNMSLRGNSGISHSQLNQTIIEQTRQYIDYKLIILEFGINALSSQQTNYNSYAKAMVSVVNTIRNCYPNAQIMIMGIGDRGQKQGTEVKSMASAKYMVNALRNVARQTGSLFWDTRAAMGGDDSVVKWQKNGFINSDYVHLNHKGGKELANVFMQSLNATIGE